MKKAIVAASGALALCLGVATWNYFGVYAPAAAEVSKDSRNGVVSIWVYRQYGLLPSTLVVDVRRVAGEASSLDVIRVLLQSAVGLKDKTFEKVVLAHSGEYKFYLEGSYFKQLGQEFGAQNVVYTLRTLPENVYQPDGNKAFPSWTGGLLGVVGKQMGDLNDFSMQWYGNDLLEAPHSGTQRAPE